jgi:hypothetical protein
MSINLRQLSPSDAKKMREVAIYDFGINSDCLGFKQGVIDGVDDLSRLASSSGNDRLAQENKIIANCEKSQTDILQSAGTISNNTQKPLYYLGYKTAVQEVQSAIQSRSYYGN